MAVAQAPPVAHAIGGALGSALALLLFFPLERARIELQTQASLSPPSSSSKEDDNNNTSSSSIKENQIVADNDGRDNNNQSNNINTVSDDDPTDDNDNDDVVSNQNLDSVDIDIDNIETDETTSSSQAYVDVKQEDGGHQPHQSPSWSMASSTTNESDYFDVYDNNDDQIQQKVEQVVSSRNSKNNNSNKSGLVPCLIKLHERNALYQGVGPVITTMATSQFVFFFLHEYFKSLMLPSLMKQQREQQLYPQKNHNKSKLLSSSSIAIWRLIASCLAGIGNVLITSPLWVTNIAIVTGQTKTNSIIGELYKMIQKKGLKHMWVGTGASLLLVSNPVIQFFCYEQLKQMLLSARRQRTKLKQQQRGLTSSTTTITNLVAYEAFLAGAIAKAIATVMTYPVQLAQTILRLKGSTYRGTMDCLLQLYNKDGFVSLYTGMKAKILQTVLTAAFTFLTYEQILGAVQVTLLKARSRKNNVTKMKKAF